MQNGRFVYKIAFRLKKAAAKWGDEVNRNVLLRTLLSRSL